MATQYSDQMTKHRSGRLVQSNEFAGKLRIMRWSLTIGAQAAIADVLMLGKLPKSARIIQGREFHSAMSTGGAAATGAIGFYDVTNDGKDIGAIIGGGAQLLGATTMDAAGQNEIANTLALAALDEISAYTVSPHEEVAVCLTISVEAFAAAGVTEGYILYDAD